MNDLCEWFFYNDDYTPLVQVITAFSLGVIFSPWTFGIIVLLFLLLIYELVIYTGTQGNPGYWNFGFRGGIILAYLAGFVIGRSLLRTADTLHGKSEKWRRWQKRNAIEKRYPVGNYFNA